MSTNTAESGLSNGTSVTTGNSDGTAGDAFGTVSTGAGQTITFSTTTPMHGALCYRMDVAAGNACVVDLIEAAASSNFSIRIYVLFESFSTVTNAQGPVNFRNSTTSLARTETDTTGHVRLIAGAGATSYSATALSTNTWYRFEMYGSGFGTASTACQVDIYAGDDTSATVISLSLSGQTTASTPDRMRFGKINGSGVLAMRFDDMLIAAGSNTPLTLNVVSQPSRSAIAPIKRRRPQVMGITPVPPTTGPSYQPSPVLNGGWRAFARRRRARTLPTPPPPAPLQPAGARRSRVFVRRGNRFTPPWPQVFVATPAPLQPTNARRSRVFVRKGNRPSPVPPQVFQGPAPAIQPVYQRIRRFVLARRPSVDGPIPTQATATPPAFVPIVQRARRYILSNTRARLRGPVPAQATTTPPAFVPIVQRARRYVQVRRAAVTQPPVPLQQPPAPPFVPAALIRRARGLIRRRPLVGYAPLDQALALPSSPERARRLIPIRRRPAAVPVPGQGSAPSSAPVRRRPITVLRRRPVLSPPPPQDAVTNPAPKRRRLIALRRTQPRPVVPPQAAPAPTPVQHPHPRPGAPRVRSASPPMPQFAPPPVPGRGGQPRRPIVEVPRRRPIGTSSWLFQPNPLYISFVAPRLRRFATRMRRGFAKIPVFGGLAPIRDIRLDFAELDPSWQFTDLSPVWTFEELSPVWGFSEPPIGWSFDELSSSWMFTEPPVRG